METGEKPFLTDLKKDLTDYVDLRLEVIKLAAYEKTAKISASTGSVLVIVFLLVFFFLFLFMTFGFYLSDLTGSKTIGFGIISLFYLLLLFIFLAIRKNIFEKFLANKIVETLTDDEETIS